jgi:hypothetical protein
MIGNPLGALERDLSQAAHDLEDLDEPRRDASELLANAVREEAPYVTGFLVSTVNADDSGVGVGAVYAGVVHDSNPYAERAASRVDVLDPFVAFVDDVLDRNLKTLYV